MRPEDRLDAGLLKLAAILMVGGIAPLLDTTIVLVALDRLGRDLGASLVTIQWVTTAYLLALAVAVPVTGWTVNRFGAKPMWLFSLALFACGSALCGLAWNAGSLIAFRVAQGFGGGLMQPIMQTVLVKAAGKQRLGRIMTVVTLVAVLSPILGPVLGGAIVADFSWRWIFFVNVPLCLLGMALAWRGLPSSAPKPASRLDVVGLLMLSPGLGATIYGLSRVGALGGFGHASVLVPLVAGSALLSAFGSRAFRRQDPLLDLRLFRVRSFGASTALQFVNGFSLYGVMMLLPLYFQQVRGHTALAAGLVLAPQGLGALLTRWAGGLTDRIGARPIVLGGMALAVLGTLPFTAIGPGTSEVLLGVALAVRGAGLGAANVAIMAGAYQDLAPDEIAHGSSAIRITQQVGGSFGTAVLAVVLQTTTFATAFRWALAFAAVAFVPAFLLPASKWAVQRRARTK
ncbi:MDR family MFS transporter [Amycolatopsis sp. CA-230715]|uniref:MDR family MFS transporter n=1 Tax=Amycolatopsis sp. CA-230715 TaxID=2745196 RepID=UPI001C0108D3|nr:MDR family MFS transporter [Amycolatopsis sp. CA-230715]QWF83764.1 putative transport protein HsrA [Amycolatopsis sp. CA-230715]